MALAGSMAGTVKIHVLQQRHKPSSGVLHGSKMLSYNFAIVIPCKYSQMLADVHSDMQLHLMYFKANY